MIEKEEIRWYQRFENFLKAYSLLEEAVLLSHERELTKLEEQGLIQRFEMVHELAWNVLKDYFEYQGNTKITGSRDASREGFQNGLIRHGEGWMSMIKSRNQSSHTYNESVANELKDKILNEYYVLFKEFKEVMFKLRS